MSAAGWALQTLHEIGIEVRVEGDELVLSGNVQELRDGDWSEIRELKPDILAELRGAGLRNSGATP